jgi:hypothetical protein
MGKDWSLTRFYKEPPSTEKAFATWFFLRKGESPRCAFLITGMKNIMNREPIMNILYWNLMRFA